MSEAGAILILIGSIFCLLAAIGMLRFPDFFSRVHAASKSGVLGAGLIFLGVALNSLDVAAAIRMIIGLAFLLLTTPLAAHLLARAGLRSGLLPRSGEDNVRRTPDAS